MITAGTSGDLCGILRVSEISLVEPADPVISRVQKTGTTSPCSVVSRVNAADLIEDSGRPAEHIAMELGYPSAGAMRALLKRYVRCSPQELRAAGGAQFVIERLGKVLDIRRSDSVRTSTESVSSQ